MHLNQEQAQEIINKYIGIYTSKELSKEHNVSSNTITTIVSGKKFSNLERPENIKEILKRKKPDGFYVCIDHIQPSQRQIEIINGSMLGDGWTSQQGMFGKKQCIASKEHIDWIYENLLPFSAVVWDNYSERKINHENKIPITEKSDRYLAGHTVQTYTHEYFKQLRTLWYPKSKKIIPINLELTPLTCAVWAADDGSNYVKKRRYALCTNGFTFDDVNLLKNKLFSAFAIKSSIEKSRDQPVLIIQGTSYDDFIELITPHFPWQCFSYKIERREMLRSHTDKFNDKKVVEIIDLWNFGETITEISKKTTVWRGTVYRILSGKTYKYLTHLIKVLASRESAINRGQYKNLKKKKIKCVETGEIFDSIKEAAMKNEIADACISRAATKNKTSCGFHWEYVED